MKIHVGYDLIYDCVAATPMVFMLNVHPSRAADLLTSDRMRVTPARTITAYTDGFGNKCVRLLAPAGEIRIAGDAIVADCGMPDPVDARAPKSIRSPTCRTTRWCSCSAAATARPTG